MSEEKVSLSAPQSPAPGEFGYVPPAELVPLPSRGKIYPVESPLHNSDTVEIRAMTAKDEDILTSRGLLKQGRAFDVLIKNCLINKSIDVEQMVVGDRNAITIALRITGYGKDYETTVECPACEEKSKHSFDLSQLPIKPLSADPIQPGQNIFSFILPSSKKEVIFKLMTGADEREISTSLSRMQKAAGPGSVESAITTRLTFQVLAIGGEKDKAKIAQIVRNLPAMDSRALRKHIDNISPGIDMTQNFLCPRCGEEQEVGVPMGTEFFWPSS